MWHKCASIPHRRSFDADMICAFMYVYMRLKQCEACVHLCKETAVAHRIMPWMVAGACHRRLYYASCIRMRVNTISMSILYIQPSLTTYYRSTYVLWDGAGGAQLRAGVALIRQTPLHCQTCSGIFHARHAHPVISASNQTAPFGRGPLECHYMGCSVIPLHGSLAA